MMNNKEQNNYGFDSGKNAIVPVLRSTGNTTIGSLALEHEKFSVYQSFPNNTPENIDMLIYGHMRPSI